MKKYGFRLLIGLITFGIGLVFVWTFLMKNYLSCEPVDLQNQPPVYQTTKFSTSPNGKIEIRFNGYGRIENRPTLIFEVVNLNTKPAKYWSFEEKKIWAEVKFNGTEKQEFRCGTGMKEFVLNSGESFTFEIFADGQIFEFLNKNGSFEFGHSFRFDEKDWQQFWSEPITISDELKKDIIKNAPEFLKQN